MGKFAEAVLGLRKPAKTKVEKQTKNRAYEIRTINDTEYFKDLIAQMEAVANTPVQVAVHVAMIEQVGKQNAYRELLQVLRKDLSTAERMIAEDQQRQRGR